jgi:FtsP/CotA-like multicopper oxidase with cupredoxin domain
MSENWPRRISRRGAMRLAGACATAAALPIAHARAQAQARVLTAAPAQVQMVGDQYPATKVWAYDGDIPGPELRLRQGERLRVDLRNGLETPTTIHWHGIRLPNAMDGVPRVTQPPVLPGEGFLYEFDLPDAGTYWYHPHAQSNRQVGHGLSGALVVEEPNAPEVDRDLVWLLSDWRLDEKAQLVEDFGNRHDLMHDGRLGNTVTINGRVPERFEVSSGERLRLRLINAANARIFELEFRGHAPRIIALDGQAVAPHAPAEGRVVIAPGQRVDLILDCAGAPGGVSQVVDYQYQSRAYRFIDLAYGAAPLRTGALPPVAPLPRNPLPAPDLGDAERHEIVLGGGMMGGLAEAKVDGRVLSMRQMIGQGLAWALNGMAADETHAHEPLFEARLGASVIVGIVNDTAWPHPMHLHGHIFRVLSRNGAAPQREEWRDTVLVDPEERVEIAFRADNPGDWMIHCHILEHQAGGMMGLFRVG